MDKMTETEIQAAGRIVMEIARRNGYDEGSYFANMLKDEMISHRNTSPDDIHAFEKATGFPWEYPTDVSVVFFCSAFGTIHCWYSINEQEKGSIIIRLYPDIIRKKRKLL